MTPRICPNCREEIPIDSGFSFDEKFNLICGSCGKIAFSASNDLRHPYFPQTGQMLPGGLLNDKWPQHDSGVKSEEPDNGE